MNSRIAPLILVTLLSVACADTAGSADDAATDSVTGGKGDSFDDRIVFQTCQDGMLPDHLPILGFEHTSSRLAARTSPHHTAQDVITNPETAATITGKFAYGTLNKDLEDELVEVWMDDCAGGYLLLGDATTDDDGRIALEVPPEDLPPVGSYALYLRVPGDDTFTQSSLAIYPVGTQIIISDIDGTLTSSDGELFRDIVADFFEPLGAGDFVPEDRAGAVELTHLRWSEQHYAIVYLTGRPYYLSNITRGWLADLAMAPGTLHLTNSNADALPTNSGVGDFKADYVRELTALGFEIAAAYGNATTDIYGYTDGGIPAEDIYIAGPNGGNEGTVAVGEGYLAHIDEISMDAPADQPFDVE